MHRNTQVIEEHQRTYVSLRQSQASLLGRSHPEILSHVQIVNQARSLEERRVLERSFFDHIRKGQASNEDSDVFLVDIKWVRGWISYLQGKSDAIPESIKNEGLHEKYFKRGDKLTVSDDFYFMTEKLWVFLQSLYGGGPAMRKRVDQAQVSQENMRVQG